MAPRLILSKAQKSAGNHAPISAGLVLGLRNKFGAASKGGDAAVRSLVNERSREVRAFLVLDVRRSEPHFVFRVFEHCEELGCVIVIILVAKPNSIDCFASYVYRVGIWV